jgi:hypothetical protein
VNFFVVFIDKNNDSHWDKRKKTKSRLTTAAYGFGVGGGVLLIKRQKAIY